MGLFKFARNCFLRAISSCRVAGNGPGPLCLARFLFFLFFLSRIWIIYIHIFSKIRNVKIIQVQKGRIILEMGKMVIGLWTDCPQNRYDL